MTALLEVRGLTLELDTPAGRVRAVHGLDLVLRAGETLALVGESGCGKSLSALALFGALPPAARVAAGQAWFRGQDLLALPDLERRRLLGRELALSFQEPGAAFDPVVPVGAQVAETLRHHLGLERRAAWRRALECLAQAGLERPEEHARRLPGELSGGQRQRAMLALALGCEPALLVADEPTSALDAPLAAELLAWLAGEARRRELALLLITHDLAVVAELAERVAVMYAGRIVEEAGVLDLFARPSHPYTRALLDARLATGAARKAFAALPGQVPAPGAWPPGCAFHPRCARAEERCRHEVPQLLPAPGDEPARPAQPGLRAPDESLALSSRRVACHLPLTEEPA
ncbi:MAG TPA: ABC transporter ATP-binding protein [Planctomycetota bacterium]